MVQFGQPEGDDPTSRFEGFAQKALDKMLAVARERGPTLMNRPPGTVPVPEDAQQEEYNGMMDEWERTGDATPFRDRFKGMTQQMGMTAAIEAFKDWDIDRRKKRGKG